jgi:asparagine synthase (glutamine-hydrolysing)
MFLMSRRIKALGIKMVLSGEGADEIFGGYLYFHKAPSREAFHAETVDKLSSLHLYDCNRANKAMAAWGVETRVPFLDRAFVDYCMSFDPVNKMIDKSFGFIEKFALRSAFKDALPPAVLWRQKEQFSDGVGYGWIDGLKAHAEQEVSDIQLLAASSRFPLNTPLTKEAYHYRELFEEAFPVGHGCEATVPFGFSIACSTARAADWDATFRACNDPSGRVVAGVHEFSLESSLGSISADTPPSVIETLA